MAQNKESIGNTLLVAFLVCLVCAVVVSTAAVVLRPIQEENQLMDRRINILRAADLYERGVDVNEVFRDIDMRFVEFETGDFVEGEQFDEDYEHRRAARDPEKGRRLEDDPADIRRQAKVGEVYLAWDDDGTLTRIILPVHGYGLWSTMYGFLALEPDAQTISGIGFYEHGETPGLGGEIDNPRWQANWEGKKLFDEDGEVAFQVIQGTVDSATPDREHKVDGLSGATLTANGVSRLVRFWVGEQGYGPFLRRMQQEYAEGGLTQ